ncbi:MAG: hypothetical protein KDK33_08775 [Leptospiraceae bacterium]|nr:hypothetical protein [Leptospiraceae bacterium]
MLRRLSLFLILIAFLHCEQARNLWEKETGDPDQSRYERKLEEMPWYDYEARDYKKYTREDLKDYLQRDDVKPANDGFTVNPAYIFSGIGIVILIVLLIYLFKDGIYLPGFRRASREEATLEFSPEQRKRDPLFDDAMTALREGDFARVMETLLEILVRFSYNEKYLSRQSGFTPREFQRMVRKVAPDAFVQLADDLSPAFEETVYALRPREMNYYEQLIHRMERQLQGVGR